MYDALSENTGPGGTQQYLDEHRHRKHLRISQTMAEYTKEIHGYTRIILIATIINVIIVSLAAIYQVLTV